MGMTLTATVTTTVTLGPRIKCIGLGAGLALTHLTKGPKSATNSGQLKPSGP